ncbi:PAN/Apple domain-containing protein, partial [Brucella anthropi]|uniref:PAN/Apple domain-containing protein n=1 Tax=Brucella anthropi TaxID=529 RepID=UPI00055FDCC8
MLIGFNRLFWAFAVTACLSAAPHTTQAAETRRIEITKDSDYFGFDLRTEKNVSLDQCKNICLGDNACLAFTYNPKVKWCFLKSDFNKLNQSVGSIAGKVVTQSAAAREVEDIGAPPSISFFAANLIDEARRLKRAINGLESSDSLRTLRNEAGAAGLNGDPRTAMEKFRLAASMSPDESEIWTGYALAALATEPSNGQERSKFQRDATSASWFAYQTSRTKDERAQALAVMAQALEKRDASRPALPAYEASLDL